MRTGEQVRGAVWVAAAMLAGVMGAQAQQPASGGQAPELKMRSLGESGTAATSALPPVPAGNFSAKSPDVATVKAFLTALWGYDPNRDWEVYGIQPTKADGVSRVTVLFSDKGPNARVQPTSFFVMPDGKHALAGETMIDFGAKPFAVNRELLQQRANGPWHGAAGKELELVEFADMQCPHCKDAQATMDRLLKDFPQAHVVYENFPLRQIHPYAEKAAETGVCVSKAKPDAFWPYLQAVYDTQGGLTAEDGDATLHAAVTKAGLDPVQVDACVGKPETRAAVEASLALGEQVGVDQTPMLAVNGRLVPVSPAALPYEVLKSIVQFQMAQDGVK